VSTSDHRSAAAQQVRGEDPRSGPATSKARRRSSGFPMPERSSVATVLGVPPLVAFGLGAAGTALGVLVDILRIGTIGWAFAVFHFLGCVLALAWVRRRGLFGPVVQPPLLVAATVPTVVLLAAPPRPGSGITERLIAIGAPLVNSFPTMAATTATVLAGAALRIVVQPLRQPSGLLGRLRPQRDTAGGGRRGSRRVRPGAGSDEARAAGRTSGSPERS